MKEFEWKVVNVNDIEGTDQRSVTIGYRDGVTNCFIIGPDIYAPKIEGWHSGKDLPDWARILRYESLIEGAANALIAELEAIHDKALVHIKHLESTRVPDELLRYLIEEACQGDMVNTTNTVFLADKILRIRKESRDAK